jgi:hypothetical protein
VWHFDHFASGVRDRVPDDLSGWRLAFGAAEYRYADAGRNSDDCDNDQEFG